eukprot:m.94605 g.94605  ORF g.94605 m.94605 type:complete len:926 (+) comp15127_c0_seq3:258-3035(+)
MGSVDEFVTALVFNLAIGLIAFVLFCVLRPGRKRLYETRAILEDGVPGVESRSLFGWIPEVLGLSDEEYFRRAGPDALVYTLFFRFGAEVFAAFSAVGLILLFPIHATGGNDEVIAQQAIEDDGQTQEIEGIDLLSLANVKDGSHRMWVHVIVAYAFTALAFWRLLYYSRIHQEYHLRHLKKRLPHQHAVLVRDRPRATSDIQAEFGQWFDDVQFTWVPRDLTALRKQLIERTKALFKLEHTQAVLALSPDKPRPQTRVGGFCCFGGTKEDAETVHQQRLDEQNDAVKPLLRAGKKQPQLYPSGFVSFDSYHSAVRAQQMLISASPQLWTVDPAPEPRDVVYPNLALTHSQRAKKKIIWGLFTALLVLFWTIPVAFVAALTTLENLTAQLPFLEPVLDLSPVLKGLLSGLLPSLALIIFLALLPMILTAMSRAQGWPSRSQISMSVLRKYFWFQVVNVFLVSLLAGAVFAQLDAIINSSGVGAYLDIFGAAVPATGTFFINYVLLLAFSGFPIQMLRIAPLIISWIKLKWLAKTKREREAAVAPGAYDYGYRGGGHLLLVLLGFVYGLVAPLILPFIFVFFALGYLVLRYQLFYVLVPAWESGGQFWPLIFERCCGALLISHWMVLAIFVVKKAPGPAVLMLPLFMVTLMYYRYVKEEHKRITQFMPLDELDTPAEEATDNDVGQRKVEAGDGQLDTMVTDGTLLPRESATATVGQQFTTQPAAANGVARDQYTQPELKEPEVAVPESLDANEDNDSHVDKRRGSDGSTEEQPAAAMATAPQHRTTSAPQREVCVFVMDTHGNVLLQQSPQRILGVPTTWVTADELQAAHASRATASDILKRTLASRSNDRAKVEQVARSLVEAEVDTRAGILECTVTTAPPLDCGRMFPLERASTLPVDGGMHGNLALRLKQLEQRSAAVTILI